MTNSLEELISQIKDRLDIVDVVSQQVVLKKSGNHYWGLCPFHKEKTPSFSVNPQKGIFKCFGCGEGGDAISFLMKINNQSFADVIKDQAEQFGIELPAAGHGVAHPRTPRDHGPYGRGDGAAYGRIRSGVQRLRKRRT